MSVLSLAVMPEDMLRLCLSGMSAPELAMLWASFDRRLQRSMARIVKTILLEPGDINDHWTIRAFLRWLGKAETLIVTSKSRDNLRASRTSVKCAFSPNALKITVSLDPSSLILERSALIHSTADIRSDLVPIESRLGSLFPRLKSLVCKMIPLENLSFPQTLTSLDLFKCLEPRQLIFVWGKLPPTLRRIFLQCDRMGAGHRELNIKERIGVCRFYRFAIRFPQLEEIHIDDQLSHFFGLGQFELEENVLLDMKRQGMRRFMNSPVSEKGSEMWTIDWTPSNDFHIHSFANFANLHTLDLVVTRTRSFVLHFPPYLTRLSLRIMEKESWRPLPPKRLTQEVIISTFDMDREANEEVKSLQKLATSLPQSLLDLTWWFSQVNFPTLREMHLLSLLPKDIRKIQIKCEESYEDWMLAGDTGTADPLRSKSTFTTEPIHAFLPRANSVSFDLRSLVSIWNDPQPTAFTGSNIQTIEICDLILDASWIPLLPTHALSISANFLSLKVVLALLRHAPKCHVNWQGRSQIILSDLLTTADGLSELAVKPAPEHSSLNSSLTPFKELHRGSISTRISEMCRYRLKAKFAVLISSQYCWRSSDILLIDTTEPEPELVYSRQRTRPTRGKPVSSSNISVRFAYQTALALRPYEKLHTFIGTLPVSKQNSSVIENPNTIANNQDSTRSGPSRLTESDEETQFFESPQEASSSTETELSLGVEESDLLKQLPSTLTHLDLRNTGLKHINLAHLPANLEVFKSLGKITSIEGDLPQSLHTWETPASTFSWKTLIPLFSKYKALRSVAFGQPERTLEVEDHDLLKISVAWSHIKHVRAELDFNQPLRLILTGMLIPSSTAFLDWNSAVNITQAQLTETSSDIFSRLGISQWSSTSALPSRTSTMSSLSSSDTSSALEASSLGVSVTPNPADTALLHALYNWITWEESWSLVRWRSFPANATKLDITVPSKLVSRVTTSFVSSIKTDSPSPESCIYPQASLNNGQIVLPEKPQIPLQLTDFSTTWKSLSDYHKDLPSTLTTLIVKGRMPKIIPWNEIPTNIVHLTFQERDDPPSGQTASQTSSSKKSPLLVSNTSRRTCIRLDSLPAGLLSLSAPSLDFDITGLSSTTLQDLHCLGSNFTMNDVRTLFDLGLKNVRTTAMGKSKESPTPANKKKKPAKKVLLR